MLICEEMFLLLRRDDGKPESAFSQNGYGLAAAVITDLLVAERLTLSDDKDPRVHVTAAGPTSHPVLDAALERLRERDGKSLSSAVKDGKLNLEAPVAHGLQAAGVIDIEEKRALGFVPAKYPIRDAAPERALRERLRAVLAGEQAPTEADAALLSILQGIELAGKVLKAEAGDLGRRELKARIEAVAQDVPAGTAAARAVQMMNTLLLTAVIIPAATSSDGGGGGGN